jgi:hypothetical protein
MTHKVLAARDRAMYRGLLYIERSTRDPAAVLGLGSALLYALSFMATTALDSNVRSYARQLAWRSFRLWRWNWPDLPAELDADTVSEFVHACGALERLGVRFPRLKRRVRTASRRFATTEYLWFDPHREPPPADVPELCACGSTSPRRRRRCVNLECRSRLGRMSRLRLWTLSLTSVFCGDRNGVPFGITYEEMMRWLPRMRAYHGPRRDVASFYDSVYAISHVVYTLNDYGVWLLDPRLLPHEFEYLVDHLDTALQVGDPDMVGEFLDSLRAFGLDNEDAHIAAGVEFLIATQNRNGSWGPQDEGAEYPRFHATWAALDGLRDFAWRGYGLSYPRLAPALQRWAKQPAPVA